jgi:Cell cycle protein.
MHPYDEIKEYSKTVCDQIRWKKAHKIIAEEIENHICDQSDAYIHQGDDEETATHKAVLQMGDAVSLGTELDKIHRPKPQWAMIALTFMLMTIGMLSNYFIGSSGQSGSGFGFTSYIIALTVFFACYFIDFSVLGKSAKFIYPVILIISVFQMVTGITINGKIYFSAGRFTVSLSLLSLIFPLAYSLLIYALRHNGYTGIALCGIGYIPFAVILLLVPSFSGFVLFSVSALLNLYIAVAKGWFGNDKKNGLLLMLIPLCGAVAAALIYFVENPYSLDRIRLAINPYTEKDGIGYLRCLVRDLLVNSKFAGMGTVPAGYGNDIPELPLAHTDYILTIITYKYGWVAFIGIIAVIAVFSVLGIRYVLRQKSVLGTLVSLSVMLTIVLQIVFYVVNNLGFGIISQLSLPLISYGNTALIINSALIGFMLSVFRTGDIIKDSKIMSPQKFNSKISYNNGELTINIKSR